MDITASDAPGPRSLEVISPKDLTIAATNGKRDLPKYLEANDIRERLNRVPAGMDRMLLTLLWVSGLRITEAVSIKKKDITFQEGVIRVTWQKSKRYRYRNQPIHPKLRELLYFYTGNMNAEDRIFPITRQRAFQISKKHLGCSPHQLRHSFAVHYLRQGGNIVNLHRLLGHSKIQTTMEYLKIVPQDLAKELATIPF